MNTQDIKNKTTKRLEQFTLINNTMLSENTFIMEFKGKEPVADVLPGQFAEVEVPGSPDVFLRRPLSVYSVNKRKNTISFYVKIIGKGTERLAELLPGERVSLIYPLGNHFNLATKGKVLLVAGGTGVAPMLMLSTKLREAGASPTLIIGGRSADDIHINDAYLKVASVFVTTEDGSLGTTGRVSDHPLLKEEFDFEKIYTCGPELMMKALSKIAKEKGVPCEVSLENTMACGFGACLCCVVKTTEGHQCVCTEGPVFDSLSLENW